MITVKDVEAALKIFLEAEKEADAISQELRYYEDQQQDLLHDLELVDHTYHEKAQIAQKLAEVRKKRREAKNQYEILEPLVSWISEPAWSRLSDKFSKVLGQMRRAQETAEKRIYMCRGDRRGEIIGKGGDDK